MQEQIHKLPKVELHSHLEGTIKPALAQEIAQRNDVSLDSNLFHSNGGYAWSDFPSFLTAYDNVSSCLRLGKDYGDITYEYLKDCAKENVVYAETFISPDHAAECGISYDDMISGIARGIDDAERDFGIVGRIIVTCVRHLGPEQGLNVVQTMVDNPHPYVVGFGMGGDENAYTLEEFADIYNIAKEAGYECTVHAGEICGPESVWDAMSFSRGLFGKPLDKNYLEWILNALSLYDKKDESIIRLSGGMKRRVLIAKALSHQFPLVLLKDIQLQIYFLSPELDV